MDAVRSRLAAFRTWRRGRPFVGSLLTVIAGIELFFSSQLDIGKLHITVGVEGFQATLIPAVMVVVGLLAMFMPAHHIFYGVIGLAVAIYSLIGVNLGGFIVGMLLGAVGGVLTVAWMARPAESAEPTGETPKDVPATRKLAASRR